MLFTLFLERERKRRRKRGHHSSAGCEEGVGAACEGGWVDVRPQGGATQAGLLLSHFKSVQTSVPFARDGRIEIKINQLALDNHR